MIRQNSGHDSRAVANEILKIAKTKGIKLTLMQLLKLVYFAHGWTLAKLNRPLTSDNPRAWQYGPVYVRVYESFKSGSAPIEEFARDDFTGLVVEEKFEPDELKLTDAVVDAYGKLHAFQLSNLTHEPNSPWEITKRERGLYSEIPNELIEKYFRAIKGNGTKN